MTISAAQAAHDSGEGATNSVGFCDAFMVILLAQPFSDSRTRGRDALDVDASQVSMTIDSIGPPRLAANRLWQESVLADTLGA